MLGGQSEEPQFIPALDTEFEIARGELRLALIRGIARRVGKSLEPISLQEACSQIPLADLFQRKVHGSRFSEVVERLFKWWR